MIDITSLLYSEAGKHVELLKTHTLIDIFLSAWVFVLPYLNPVLTDCRKIKLKRSLAHRLRQEEIRLMGWRLCRDMHFTLELNELCSLNSHLEWMRFVASVLSSWEN